MKILNSLKKFKCLEVLSALIFLIVPIILDQLNNKENFQLQLMKCFTLNNVLVDMCGEYNLSNINNKPVWSKGKYFLSQVVTDSDEGNSKLWLLQSREEKGSILHLYNTSLEENPPFNNWKSPNFDTIPKLYNIKPISGFFEFSKVHYKDAYITPCYETKISKKQYYLTIFVFILLIIGIFVLYFVQQQKKSPFNI